MKYYPNTHIVGKVYDLTQENMNALLDEIDRLNQDYDAALMALNIAEKEIQRYRNALQSYAYLADGDWYGPDDKYYNIGHTAREALGLDEPDEVYDYDGL